MSEVRIKRLTEVIGLLESGFNGAFDLGDRLSKTSFIQNVHYALFLSVKDWGTWLSNPMFMSQFEDSELNELFKDLRDATLYLIYVDKKWGEKQLERQLKVEKKLLNGKTYVGIRP